MTDKINILGVGIDHVSREEALSQATKWLHGQRNGPAHIVTANPEMIMVARAQPTVRDILDRANLVVADGMGVVWASRFLGCPLPHRVAGIDLATDLLAWAAAHDVPVYLLGARHGVAEEAATNLQRRFSGLRIAGTHHGYFSESDEDTVVGQINASGAGLLLVALGVPRQELWIDRHRANLRANLVIGVGGALDVFAGRVRRAPRWTHRIGLEWAYRLAKEPQRIWRMRLLPIFGVKVMMESVRQSLKHRTR